MSLTIRMRRALAAFCADPYKPVPEPAAFNQIVTVPLLKDIQDFIDSTEWKIHSDYHRSRIIHGKRLNWHINGKGKQSAQYGTTMYYGNNVRQLFRGVGLKDTW